MGKSLVLVVALIHSFKGTLSSTCNPVKTWPLGRYILNQEILSNDPPAPTGIFNYTQTNLGYDGLLFCGNSSSYVDVKFDGSSTDYSLFFYIKPTVYGGCILHYKCFPSVETGITEYRLDLNSDGTLTFSVKTNDIDVENGGSATSDFVVQLNQWSILIIGFDMNKKYAKIKLGDGSEMKEDVLEDDTVHVGPGITRLASPQDGVGSSFEGGISCLHYILQKDICESDYESMCNQSNWPSTTTTTSTTSSSSTSTMSLSITSSTSTSTTSSTTSTTAASTIIATTALTKAPVILSSSISSTDIYTGWRRCNKHVSPTDFADTNDVIDIKFVHDVRECLLECNRHSDCMMFSFRNISGSTLYLCKTGKSGSFTQHNVDSNMFECVA